MLRQPARRNPGRVGQGGSQFAGGASIKPPVGGWDAVSPLADMPDDRAPLLDNWFPQPGYVEVRRGHQVFADTTEIGPVESLMVWNGLTAATSKMFACGSETVYDITAGGYAVSEFSCTNNRWQWVNFTTAGGKFLWMCNGADDPRHYNGTVWATPAITGITPTDIINVNAHKNRLWFILKDSTKAAYLATSAVAGAATEFQLGGFLSRGGYLVAMGTWTRDGGAGEDDLAVFISSRGQCIVYQGTDPASASTWSMIGVFDLGSPIGYRCFTKVAGDLALINIDGVLPLSQALHTDRGAASAIAITANINNAMNAAARSYSANFGWQLTPYPKGTMAILNVPIIEGESQHQYVMNTLTGAWCRFTGWDANCFVVFRDALYFGGNSGLISLADYSSMDQSDQVDAIGQTAYNYFSSRGALKQWNLIQPLVTTDSDVTPSIGLSTDFADNAVLSTPISADTESALYDDAIYDTDVYPQEARNTANWTGVTGVGQAASVHFRARTGRESGLAIWGLGTWGVSSWSLPITGDVTVRLNGFNVNYERGGKL